jgi:cellulose synthase/poly-beta-1,6-N-acetylglucosamine synthase-like glycosyltransferase
MFNVIYTALVCLFFLVHTWSAYNLPILAAGIAHTSNRNPNRPEKSKSKKTRPRGKNVPSYTIVIPAKNEEKVMYRLLAALSQLEYPKDKKEVIIVEDGSTDKTVEICEEYARRHDIDMKILRKPFSNGKPSALNHGIEQANGEIIGFFDADSVPTPDTLLNVCRYFEDPKVAAVQGRTLSINSEENMLTKFISYEEAVWCEAYLEGKDVLGLFVHLKGSCQFIRRDALEMVNYFDENSLSEDMEMSVKLTEKGCKIRYAPDVCSWQESAANLKQLFIQRTRWFRGTTEVAFKYGRLMTKLSKKTIDTEATLFGPFVLIASLLTYGVAVYSLFVPFHLHILWQISMQFTAIVTTISLLVCGLALIYASKPRKVANLLWFPFIYCYWSLQAFLALYAVLLFLFHRPRVWLKTEKKGTTTAPLLLGK